MTHTDIPFSTQQRWDYVSTLPLINQIAAYSPPIKKDSINSREIRRKKRASRKLYRKRIILAQKIIYFNTLFHKENPEQTTPDKEQRKNILAKSLISSQLSTITNDGWINHALLISDNFGGWKAFIRGLTNEIEILKYYRHNSRNIFITIYSAIIITLGIMNTLTQYNFSYINNVTVSITILTIGYMGTIFLAQEPEKRRKKQLEPHKLESKQKLRKSDVHVLLKFLGV